MTTINFPQALRQAREVYDSLLVAQHIAWRDQAAATQRINDALDALDALNVFLRRSPDTVAEAAG